MVMRVSPWYWRRRPSWWFYLHDTMEVGPSFRARLLDKASHVLRVQPQARAMALTWQVRQEQSIQPVFYTGRT